MNSQIRTKRKQILAEMNKNKTSEYLATNSETKRKYAYCVDLPVSL